MANVTVYSTPSCPWCVKAKEFLEKNKVQFEYVNVQANRERAKEMVAKSGQMGVPVILIDDEVIIGFDKARISSLLNIKS